MNHSSSPSFTQLGRQPARLYFLDWLRVIAVLGVFLFHAVYPFDLTAWHIKNAEQSTVVTFFIAFMFPWGMLFFFLLAGAGSWFALRRRTATAYARAEKMAKRNGSGTTPLRSFVTQCGRSAVTAAAPRVAPVAGVMPLWTAGPLANLLDRWPLLAVARLHVLHPLPSVFLGALATLNELVQELIHEYLGLVADQRDQTEARQRQLAQPDDERVARPGSGLLDIVDVDLDRFDHLSASVRVLGWDALGCCGCHSRPPLVRCCLTAYNAPRHVCQAGMDSQRVKLSPPQIAIPFRS
jgi:hypothetical protein